ncbi:unnamed protein product, partial [Rotaria sp. Silwood2]
LHETSGCLNITRCISPENSVILYPTYHITWNNNELELRWSWFHLLQGYCQQPSERSDFSFNTLVEEPLSATKLITMVNNREQLTPYVIDSLKRYNSINDIHEILPQCTYEMTKSIMKNNSELCDSFMNMIEYITTRVLLVTTIESMSYDSQRHLSNFIKRNDLSIPFSYYVPDNITNKVVYKINFNCIYEPLCLTTNNLYIQMGSDSTLMMGKTSLLPYIFTDKRKQSLSTNVSDVIYRNSCIDVLFSKVRSASLKQQTPAPTVSYAIFDVHGQVTEETNLLLIKSTQLYASVQLLYITQDDFPASSSNENNDKDDFLSRTMNYSSASSSIISTVVVIFDKNYDNEMKTEQLINLFKEHYAKYKWPNIYWTTAPPLNSGSLQGVSEFKRKCRARRLLQQFSNIFDAIHSKAQEQQQIPFRSCFSIQLMFFPLTGDQHIDYQRLKKNHIKFETENQLHELFGKLSDHTDNLKIVTPISYYQSELNHIKKKLNDMSTTSEVRDQLTKSLLKLRDEKRKNSELNVYHQFMISLINNCTYMDLLITEVYLEIWRTKYVPNLKDERERAKEEKNEHLKMLHKQQDLVLHNGNNHEDVNELKLLNEKIDKIKKQFIEIDNKLANVDLTIGLMCDELFALYEYYSSDAPPSSKILDFRLVFDTLAKNIANLVYKGFAIHVLRHRPLIFHSHLMELTIKQLHKAHSDGPLVVLTVVGEQSSAKSSLLNATFGSNFRVSSGRCTIGIYLGKIGNRFSLISTSIFSKSSETHEVERFMESNLTVPKSTATLKIFAC